jgi:hypothetical protein
MHVFWHLSIVCSHDESLLWIDNTR